MRKEDCSRWSGEDYISLATEQLSSWPTVRFQVSVPLWPRRCRFSLLSRLLLLLLRLIRVSGLGGFLSVHDANLWAPPVPWTTPRQGSEDDTAEVSDVGDKSSISWFSMCLWTFLFLACLSNMEIWNFIFFFVWVTNCPLPSPKQACL